GTSSWGYSGDGGRAVAAQLRNPRGIAVDGAGNLFIADTVNNRIRKVDPSGVISTLAGSGAFGFAGDGGSAVSAQLASPNSVSVDDTGNLYIADTGNNRIRKVTRDGSINTVAGGGTLLILGTSESWPGTSVALRGPLAAAPDSKGNLYVADSGDNLVWRMNSNGMIQIALGDRTSSPALTSIWMPIAAAVISGWVRITPGGGQSAPIPQVVFSFRPGTVT